MTDGSQGFWAFYRQYTRSSIHTAATAALTAIGLLVFVHWSFAILAVTIYILPPIVLYLYEDPEADQSTDTKPTETGIRSEHGPKIEQTSRQSTGIPREHASDVDNAEEFTDIETDQDESIDRIEPEPRTAPINPEDGVDAKSTADTTREPDSTKAETSVGVSDSSHADREWITATSPTDEGLCDVIMADDGPYIIGDEGTVLARRDRWEVILKHGPTTNSNALCGVAVSTDGRHVWFAGNSGVFGQYDIETSQFTDYSAPQEITNDWADVAAVGPAGEETLYLVDGSGQVLRGTNNGGEVRWDKPRTPGDGSSITSVVFIEEAGYLCDTNGSVYETTDDGDTWEWIGVENADPDFTDIAPIQQDAISISCDDGTVFRYDGVNWTNMYVCEEALCAIDRNADTGLMCGGNGAIYKRTQGRWEHEPTSIEVTLHGIAIGTEYPSIAVGEDGTILEYI